MSSYNDSKPSNKRRDTLRKLVVSGGIVGVGAKWSKPVVDSVVLPAHALTSDPLRDPCLLTIQPNSPTTYFVLVSGTVVPPAVVPIHIVVTTGGQTVQHDTNTNGSGAYASTPLGPFDICVSPSDPVATVTSSAIADDAHCTAPHGKTTSLC